MTATAPDSSSTLRAGLSPQSIDPAQRRNIWLLGIDMAIFSMGLGALGQLTVIPLFVSKLTDSPLAVGAVAAAIQIGWLPQIFIAGTIERTERKWPWVCVFGTLERMPTLILVV